jgi:hypothetical protein
MRCTCGKPLRVGDEHAGKRVKCPACGALLTAERAGEFDDFEVLEEAPAPTSPPAPQPLPPEPEPAAQPATPSKSKPRVKATVEEEKPAAAPPPATPGVVGKPKKKKKKKAGAAAGEEDDDWYERMRESEAKMRRILRGSAFVVAGVLVLVGAAVLYFGYGDDLEWAGGVKVKLFLIIMVIAGLAAVGKGAIGLATGQFLGDDDD